MKKLLSLILVLTMLVGMAGFASADAGLTFKVSSTEAAPGEEIQVQVSIENNPGVCSVELVVEFDTGVLEWIAPEKAKECQEDYDGMWDVFVRNGETGVTVQWFGTGDNYYNDGLFCTLTFKVKEDAPAGESPVTLSFKPDTVYDENEDDVPYTFEPGAVTVTGETPEPLTGYYLVGTLNEWTPAEAYKFATNPDNGNEYMLTTTLAVNDEIKVVYVENGEIKTWYPDNAGNYVVDEAHAGEKTIYFKTTYDSGWAAFGGYIWIGEAVTPKTPARVYGSSVTLNGTIALNFYLIVPEELLNDEAAYVKLNDETYLISKADTRTQGEDLLHQFSIGVAAKEMNDAIVLSVYDGTGAKYPLVRNSNSEDITATGYIYSVQTYIQNGLKGSGTEELKALLQAMSDYGSMAQVQFNYNTENLADVKGDLASVTAETVAAYEAKITYGKATGVTFLGGSLLLESTTTINLYFSLDEGDISDYVFKVGSAEKTPEETDDGWMIQITDIKAKNLDQTKNVTVTNSDGVRVLLLKYSALSYAYTALDEGYEDPDPDLVKALVLYNQAADAYFG